MAQLSDYEVSQIQRSIQDFTTKYNEIIRKLSKDRYSSDLRKAESALSSYTREEGAALKETESIISKKMNGSGFFSHGGLNKILENKVNDSNKQVGEILDSFNKEISAIFESLPRIGVGGRTDYSFEETEYEGDVDYSSDEFNYVKTNDSFSFGTSFESYEDVSVPTKSNEVSISQTALVGEYTTDKKDTVISIGSVSNESLTKFRCSNVKEIQANAFKGCPNLNLIVINKGIEKININSFRGISNDCLIAFEDSKETIETMFTDKSFLVNRKVIFNYSYGDENYDKSDVYQAAETKNSVSEKRTVIRKGTPLDTNEVKQNFLDKNSKYSLNLDELNEGIVNAGTNVDKDQILYEALLARRKRALSDGSYWDYASALGYALKFARKLNKTEDALSIIYGLLYLDSSGYRMVNGKYNSYKQSPDQMYYHPKMEFGDLYSIVSENGYTSEYLSSGYRNSPYVKELNDKIKDSYYSIDDSIKLMIMALQDPDHPFYPAQSGIIRKH